MSEAAVTAAPATIAGCPGPTANWHWLASAAEMAAEVSGVWPIAWSSSAPRWPVRLGLLQPGPWVLCAISDPSDEVPAPKDPGWFGESGRGLHVVDSLCDEWGCTEPGTMGKVVWAMFATRDSR